MMFIIKEFDKYYPEGFIDAIEDNGVDLNNITETPEGSYYLIKNQSMLLRSIWESDQVIIGK